MKPISIRCCAIRLDLPLVNMDRPFTRNLGGLGIVSPMRQRVGYLKP